ncbi:MAG: fibronectin type III domain-containing protein [Candidatus Marinimicrobia bacterium]|nr:fibronectin type III domain-containing protein [Candidatus Neomarinimicrobiota bacterium]
MIRSYVKIGFGALLGAIGYAQELNIASTSGPSVGEVKVRYANVVLAISLDQPRGLDRPADIYPAENISALEMRRLELTHDEFLLLLNNSNSFKYDVINPETGLPRVLIRIPTNSISDELQHTCKPWATAGTFQGNEETGHGGAWHEGVSSTATIAYDSWGSLGSDSGANQGYAQWNCDAININSSKVRILFRTMRSEGVPGSCRIYLRNLDSGKWVYWGSITDGSDNLWAISLETATELQAHISPQGRCALMAVSNDGWTFDQVKFEYTCRLPDVPVLVSPYRGASGVAYSATYFDWPDINGARGYEIAISPGETYRVTSSFCFKTTAPNTSYTWKVRAENPCGWGAWSTTKTFTTGDNLETSNL